MPLSGFSREKTFQGSWAHLDQNRRGMRGFEGKEAGEGYLTREHTGKIKTDIQGRLHVMGSPLWLNRGGGGSNFKKEA